MHLITNKPKGKHYETAFRIKEYMGIRLTINEAGLSSKTCLKHAELLLCLGGYNDVILSRVDNDMATQEGNAS